MSLRELMDPATTSRETTRENPRARVLNVAEVAARCALLGVLAAALLMQSGCTLAPSRSGSGEGTVEVVVHDVSAEETLASIADDYYGTPRAARYLAQANGIDADDVVEPGVKLEVPVGERDIERYRLRTEAKILYNRGTMLAAGGDYAKAKEEFAAALRADPRFVDAGYNLGVVLLSTGEAEHAVAVFEQILTVRPDEALFEFALGKAHFDADRAGEALAHFERSIELDPLIEDARFAHAVALLAVGESETAVFELDAYLREFPDGAWAAEARAELENLAREAVETP